MKKYLSNISAFVILFLLTFLVSEFLFPATAFAQTTPPELSPAYLIWELNLTFWLLQ